MTAKKCSACVDCKSDRQYAQAPNCQDVILWHCMITAMFDSQVQTDASYDDALSLTYVKFLHSNSAATSTPKCADAHNDWI